MSVSLHLESLHPGTLQNLCGIHNCNLKRIEAFFGVRLHGRPGDWEIEGEQAEAAAELIRRLAEEASRRPIAEREVQHHLRSCRQNVETDTPGAEMEPIIAGRRHIRGKTPNQRHYLQTIQNHALTLAVGPAGSGKTYLAVAAAVAALQHHEVERIILTRPAVEAGERLGFLPGDLQQKIDPYLRPLFDALADMLGVDKLASMQESGRIEIAPLAYMRGRTLNDAFIILDEAQNTTREQMKMFLTRLGFGSKMVVTGDVTQVDLPQHHASGLLHALQVMEHLEDVGICRLSSRDVVRHPLVERIVDAYEQYKA